MSESKLDKFRYTEIMKLRLCNKNDGSVKFILDKSPFDEDDEDNIGVEESSATTTTTTSDAIIIIGRIFPNSEIYKEGAFQIEIKLPSTYPYDTPIVHFLTPIYHPNVGSNREFYHDLIRKTARWTNKTSLVDVIKAIVDRIDTPDINDAINQEAAEEYVQNRTEFNRKALEMVKKHGLPRD